jgi:DnaJ-class molecular chaperone
MNSTTGVNEPCKCCGGSGTQYNALTGQIEICKCCGGTGEWNKPGITY